MKGKNVAIFSAGAVVGFICCGTLATRAFLSSDKMRKVLGEAVASKIADVLFDESTRQHQYGGSSLKKSVKYQPAFFSRDIVFDTLEDARDVLRYLKETLNEYGVVTVADFRELAGQKQIGYTDMNYGWTNLAGVYIEQVSTGAHPEYAIILQKPIHL